MRLLKVSDIAKADQTRVNPLVEDSRLVFDIGAFTGNSHKRLREMGFSRIVSVEPNPSAFHKLFWGSVWRPGVTLLNAAVAESTGEMLEFVADRHHPWLASSNPEWLSVPRHQMLIQNPERFEATTVSICALVNYLGLAPRYIKIDTEGGDTNVLKSLCFVPSLVSVEWISELEDNTLQLLRQLQDIGYRDFQLTLEESSPNPNAYRAASQVKQELGLVSRHNGTWGNLWARQSTG